jgi:hypothetical protein
LEAGLPPTEVADLKLISVCLAVFGMLEVHPSHPVSCTLQEGDEVVTYESARTGDENPRLLSHILLS